MFADSYRLEEPIGPIVFILGLLHKFFGYNFPKPEPMWMKFGTEVTGHGAHSRKKNGRIRSRGSIPGC